MPKDTSWNKVGKPHGNLCWNVNVGTDEDGDYYPLQVKMDMPVFTGDGQGKSQVTEIRNVGTNQVDPFNFSTLQGLKDIHDALPTWAKGMFKDLAVNAINEDPSV